MSPSSCSLQRSLSVSPAAEANVQRPNTFYHASFPRDSCILYRSRTGSRESPSAPLRSLSLAGFRTGSSVSRNCGLYGSWYLSLKSPNRRDRTGSVRQTGCSLEVGERSTTKKNESTKSGEGEKFIESPESTVLDGPLNSIVTKRVVLVRHGESSWNAIGRIQGSSDFSVLTTKGESQAETNRQMLRTDSFDLCISSPLQRSYRTAEIIWDGRQPSIVTLSDLREIDLYSFQGLMKEEGKAKYGENYRAWQIDAANFEIDGHYPVRELWERASNCWKIILAEAVKADASSVLVVAHNAVNQALVATATGLGPEYFRKLLQSNCGVSVLDFSLSLSPSPTSLEMVEMSKQYWKSVTLNRLNQTPSPPIATSASAGRKAKDRIILVCQGETDSSAQDILPRSSDERLNMLGIVQSRKLSELLLDVRIDAIITAPSQSAEATAKEIEWVQSAAECLGADCIPRFVDFIPLAELREIDVPEKLKGLKLEGDWCQAVLGPEQQIAVQDFTDSSTPDSAVGTGDVADMFSDFTSYLKEKEARLLNATEKDKIADNDNIESYGVFSERVALAWKRVTEILVRTEASSSPPLSSSSRTLVVVAHNWIVSSLISHSLELPGTESPKFHVDRGSISVLDFPDGPAGPSVVRCMNYTAHLGRWAVPVTSPGPSDEDF